MAYREITMIEIKEVLRRWVSGIPKKRLAAQLGLDPKTVRRYVQVAEQCGVRLEDGIAGLTDDRVSAVIIALKQPAAHPHGDPWWACEAERSFIEEHLKDGLRLTKILRLLTRKGVQVPYSTLHRFAVQELAFGRKAATVPVADGEPGHELQVDTGWVLSLEPDDAGVRRRKKAFVFTPNVSRYRFVYPIKHETTAEAIAACEAAWAFYGGVFRVMVIDNMKAVVAKADRLEPQIIEGFREYAQARGFFVDATRVRRPKDKPRVERAVRDVRDDCFAGEQLRDLDEARERALRWCRDEYGMRRHSTTHRMPREHFTHVEAPELLPVPAEPYDGGRGAACRARSTRPRSACTPGRWRRGSPSCGRPGAAVPTFVEVTEPLAIEAEPDAGELELVVGRTLLRVRGLVEAEALRGCSTSWRRDDDPIDGADLRVHGAAGHAAQLRRAGAGGPTDPRPGPAQRGDVRLRQPAWSTAPGAVVGSRRLQSAVPAAPPGAVPAAEAG
jgi:transposase